MRPVAGGSGRRSNKADRARHARSRPGRRPVCGAAPAIDGVPRGMPARTEHRSRGVSRTPPATKRGHSSAPSRVRPHPSSHSRSAAGQAAPGGPTRQPRPHQRPPSAHGCERGSRTSPAHATILLSSARSIAPSTSPGSRRLAARAASQEGYAASGAWWTIIGREKPRATGVDLPLQWVRPSSRASAPAKSA